MRRSTPPAKKAASSAQSPAVANKRSLPVEGDASSDVQWPDHLKHNDKDEVLTSREFQSKLFSGLEFLNDRINDSRRTL
jgi:hypothetical protein